MTDAPTTKTADPQEGDWVRFYQAGNMVLGIVQYVRCQDTYPNKMEALTEIGAVQFDRILELRRVEVLR